MKNNKISTDSYKKERVTKGIWYRIISVLSAITVFCTTYALILPAITMEDPTLGVRLEHKFEFESETLDIDFFVSGRAIFKDKNVDIENPVGDLVDLQVTVLDEDDKAYKDYEEYAVNNIGAEDVAQITALKLKFTYLGHELDMSKCEVKAEINAKEVFFTDIIGSVPDDIYYTQTNHPMATPDDDVLPLAKAVTVAQSTTTELSELPVVYTSNTSEVSTLTVDVKGDDLFINSYSLDDYWFNVAYYVAVDKPITMSYAQKTAAADDKYLKFHDRRENTAHLDLTKSYGTTKQTIDGSEYDKKLYYPFDKEYIKYVPMVPYDSANTGPGSLYVFQRQKEYTMAYRTVRLQFTEHNSLFTVNKLANSDNYADPTLYTNVTGVKAPYVNNEDEENNFPYTFKDNIGDVFEQDVDFGEVILGTSYNTELLFTHIPGSGSRTYIHNETTLVLVYTANDSLATVSDDVTLIDYDNSDGEMTTTTCTEGTYKGTTYGTIRTDDKGINSIYSPTAYGSKFMFGEAWAFSYNPNKIETNKMERSHFMTVNGVNGSTDKYYINDNVVNTNGTYNPKTNPNYVPRQFLYGLVNSVTDKGYDYVPIFDQNIIAPDLFSTTNDYIPSTMVMDNLVGAFRCKDNELETGPATNIQYEKKAITWKSYTSTKTITVENFSGWTYRKPGKDLLNINPTDSVKLPKDVINSANGFTIEFKFGGINLNNVGDNKNVFNILSVNEKYNGTDKFVKFNLYIKKDTSELRINSIGQIKQDLKVADAKLVDNGNVGEKRVDLLTNSTLAITYDCKDEGVLRIYINGVEVFSYKTDLGSIGLNNDLRLGTNRDFTNYEDRKLRIQIKEIRLYNYPLRSTGVAQNAKYDGNYAPTVSDGLVAEYDADDVAAGTKSWADGTSNTEIDLGNSGANYKFTGKECAVTGKAGTTISIPSISLDGDYTIEVEFGNIKNISSQTQIIGANSTNSDNKFSIFFDKRENHYGVSLSLNGQNSALNLFDENSLAKDDINADSLSYSTLSFVYSYNSNYVYVYVNGLCVDKITSYTPDINLSSLVFGPNTEGSMIEYRTIRIYDRALNQLEVVQNSQHDGTYNAGKMQYAGSEDNKYNNSSNTNSSGLMGKTVIGGREAEFIRRGDTYILSSINVASYNKKEAGDTYQSIYENERDLDKFVLYGVSNFEGSNWPADNTKTYDPDGEIFGHDYPYGGDDDEYKKRYPYSKYAGTLNPSKPPWDGNYNHSGAWEYFKPSNDGENHNAFFSMKYKIDFTLDADYVGDLEYLFQGDDDLWIFLYDKTAKTYKLVVDIGGIHASEGQIVDLWNYIGDDGKQRYSTDRTTNNYTLYVFLLERGAKASTCYMEFTIPAIASLAESEGTGSLSVSKTVENVETSHSFKFTIKFDAPFAGGMYTITDVYNNSRDPQPFGTDIDPFADNTVTFHLKHGERAVFSGIPLEMGYTVKEEVSEFYHTSYRKNMGTITDFTSTTGVTGTISENIDRIVFYNTMGVELPSTGESGVVAFFIPFIVATAWMFTMPYMDKTNKWRAKGRKREE